MPMHEVMALTANWNWLKHRKFWEAPGQSATASFHTMGWGHGHLLEAEMLILMH